MVHCSYMYGFVTTSARDGKGTSLSARSAPATHGRHMPSALAGTVARGCTCQAEVVSCKTELFKLEGFKQPVNKNSNPSDPCFWIAAREVCCCLEPRKRTFDRQMLPLPNNEMLLRGGHSYVRCRRWRCERTRSRDASQKASAHGREGLAA
jgi:hypothetical protein